MSQIKMDLKTNKSKPVKTIKTKTKQVSQKLPLAESDIKTKTLKPSLSVKKIPKTSRTTKLPKEQIDDSHLYDQSQNQTQNQNQTHDMKKLQQYPEIKSNPVSQEEALITDKAFVVVGNVDAGKSTLIGTLITDINDDGRGSARLQVAKHKHEIISGRTSDISTKILKFKNGKTATLIDLCGHNKYFTTTASGISGMMPDYAIVVASPSRGVCEMTQQHFKMLMSYNIPVMIVITHIDMAIEKSCEIIDKKITELCKTYKRTCEFMNSYYKYHAYTRGCKLAQSYGFSSRDDIAKIIAKSKEVDSASSTNSMDSTTSTIDVTDDEIDEYIELVIKKNSLTPEQTKDLSEYLNFDAVKLTAIGQINQGLKMAGGKQTYIPGVYVSNVDGYCLDVVKQSMMTVEPRDLWSKDENANSIVKFFRTSLKLPTLGLEQTHVGTTFYIDKPFTVKGVGLVISGITRGEKININDDLYLGPMNKAFVKIKIRSIHNDNQEPVEYLGNHHRGCLAIKGLKDDLKKNQISRGMVLISKQEMIKHVCYRFEAAVTIFGGLSATLRTGYSPIIHAGTIRQAAKLILPDDNVTDEDQKMIASLSKRERKEVAQKKIRSGAVEKVTFKFRIKPEYLEPGSVFVFRSGDIHGVGCVTKSLSLDQDDDAQPEPLKKKFRRTRPTDETKRISFKPGTSNTGNTVGINNKNSMPEKVKINVTDLVAKQLSHDNNDKKDKSVKTVEKVIVKTQVHGKSVK
jgi:GTPase